MEKNPYDCSPNTRQLLRQAGLAEEDVQALVGLSLDDATRRADVLGLNIRVVAGDEADEVLTADLRYRRLNVSTAKGVVTRINGLG